MVIDLLKPCLEESEGRPKCWHGGYQNCPQN